MQVEERIELLLASSPDREMAARFLRRLRAERPAGFDRIAHSAPALRGAIAIFSHSSFLSESILRDPARMVEVASSDRVYRVLSTDEFEQMLESFDGTLASFRRRQLLRIALRDVLGVATLAEITQELSNLADAILDVAYRRVGGPALGFSVISLGILGGSELN